MCELKTLSLVVVNYNSYLKLIETITIFDEFEHVVIVDNGSSDNSFYELKKYFCKHNNVDIIRNEEARGFAVGTNTGIKYLLDKYKTEYILCLSYDIVVSVKALKNCLKFLEENDKCGLISMRFYELNGIEGNSAWHFPTYYKLLKLTSWLYRKKNSTNIVYTYENKEDYMKVDVVRGSLMMFNSKIIKEVDFFDERTFLYCEENIICKKIKDKGYFVVQSTNDFYLHSHEIKNSKYVNLINFKAYLNSSLVYMKYYMSINRTKFFFYYLLCKISYIEQFMINFIKKIFRQGV